MSDEGLEIDYFDLDEDMSDMDYEPTGVTPGLTSVTSGFGGQILPGYKPLYFTNVATYSMETRKLDPSEYGLSEKGHPVGVASFDNYDFPLFNGDGYSIIPFYKVSGRTLTDYTKAQARGDLVRCSSATEVYLGVHAVKKDLFQIDGDDGHPFPSVHLINSGHPVYQISAVDVPFILGSQDRFDFYLIPTQKDNEQSVTAWRIPKLK